MARFASKLPLPQLREDTQQQIVRILAASVGRTGTLRHSCFGHFTELPITALSRVMSRFDPFDIALFPQEVRAYMDRILALPAMEA